MLRKIISIIEYLQKIYPSVTMAGRTRQRLALLEKLGRTANLSGTAMSYIGGGYDSATAFTLNPDAKTLINVSRENLYDLGQLSASLPILQKIFRDQIGLNNFDGWLYACCTDTTKAEAAAKEFKRMYIMDGSRLTNIIPCTLINNTLIPDEQGEDLKMIYSNGQIIRTVEIIHSDYSKISAKNTVINEYIQNYPGLHSALIKASQNLFDKISFGYQHFQEAHYGLSGTIIQDYGNTPEGSFFRNPRKILFDEQEQFGYGNHVFIGQFSDLLPLGQFYQNPISGAESKKNKTY